MESRRDFVEKTVSIGLFSTGLSGRVIGVGGLDFRNEDAQIVWQQSYPEVGAIDSVAVAQDGGYIYAEGIGGGNTNPKRIRLTAVDALGRLQRQKTISLEGSLGIGDDTPCDIVRTDEGYALARGTWLGLLNPDLSVRTSSNAPPWADAGAENTHILSQSDTITLALHWWAPSSVRTRVHQFDTDASYQWTKEHGSANAPTFLVPADPGLAIGGVNVGNNNLWLAVHSEDGTLRWEQEFGQDSSISPGDAVSDDLGVTIADEQGLFRVGWNQSLQWRESFRPFPDRPASQQTVEHILRRRDGGYVFIGEYQGTPDRYTVIGATSDRQREWRVEYEAAGNSTDIDDVTKGTEGEYVLAGVEREGSNTTGLGLLVTSPDTQPPTAPPSPTPSPTPTRTSSPSPSPTASSTPTQTPSRTQTSTPSTTTTPQPDNTESAYSSVSPNTVTSGATDSNPSETTRSSTPGFGMWSAIAATSIGAWLARRRTDRTE